MSNRRQLIYVLLSALILTYCTGQGCGTSSLPITGGTGDGGNASQTETLRLETSVTDTEGASGLAIRPSDGALFAVNARGLFGPLHEGDRISQLTPFGAANLASPQIFDAAPANLVLTITNSGEFWIGSQCCGTVAVVPPAGGDAASFTGLLDSSNIKPEAMAIVPPGFEGSQVHPGNLLVGQQTTFSRLAAIDVAGTRQVVNVSNPLELNREAHALAFGLGPILYSGRSVLATTLAGIQTIDATGAPTALTATTNTSVHSMVVRTNGNIVFRGRHDTASGDELNGVLVYSPADTSTTMGAALLTSESSADDELVITADRATIYLSLPLRNEIVRVVDRE